MKLISNLPTCFLFTTLASSIYYSSVCMVDAAVFDVHTKPIGIVRTDPILDQQCLSGHVHVFYGAKQLYPNTTYEMLRSTDPMEVGGNIRDNNSVSSTRYGLIHDTKLTFQMIIFLQSSLFHIILINECDDKCSCTGILPSTTSKTMGRTSFNVRR